MCRDNRNGTSLQPFRYVFPFSVASSAVIWLQFFKAQATGRLFDTFSLAQSATGAGLAAVGAGAGTAEGAALAADPLATAPVDLLTTSAVLNIPSPAGFYLPWTEAYSPMVRAIASCKHYDMTNARINCRFGAVWRCWLRY
jgi:hypothetical protein